MNVPTIGRGPGSVATLPDPQTESAVEPAARAPSRDAGFTRIAWFDVNGDGHIDSRSPLDGGDGTLIVPHDAVDLPTYSRTVRRPELRVAAASQPTGATAHAAHDDSPSVPPVSDAQTRQAIDAYQRYGQPADATPTKRAVA